MQETWIQFLGQEDSPGEGNGNPLQYSCLENPMDGGAWWATVHRVAKSWTRLSNITSLHIDNDLFSHLLSSLLFTFSFVFLSSLTNIKDFFHFFLYICFSLNGSVLAILWTVILVHHCIILSQGLILTCIWYLLVQKVFHYPYPIYLSESQPLNEWKDRVVIQGPKSFIIISLKALC